MRKTPACMDVLYSGAETCGEHQQVAQTGFVFLLCIGDLQAASVHISPPAALDRVLHMQAFTERRY